MTDWSVEFLTHAEKDLAKTEKSGRRRIIEKTEWLSKNFDSIFPINIKGEFRDFYKLRVGDWRVFYRVDWNKNIIFICLIERRDKAYRIK